MAAHLEEQQELDNFKYFWKTTGKWLFALLILAALGYLGYTVYQTVRLPKIRKRRRCWQTSWKRRKTKPRKAKSMPNCPNSNKATPFHFRRPSHADGGGNRI
ncbi:membrane protein [Neisseria gonorrhoeae]|uniref:Membrane protein n=1 Tax=Neisseria gonorrhoeae TaxID=485 RepID=A0A378W0V9_NEIGO|nr:membrane protein [Neisseria gonorrhoeae]